MEKNDKTVGQTVETSTTLNPDSLSMIERIFYYENLRTIEADNDNSSNDAKAKSAACFESWALPDYMRN
jgi:hypothetical protein